MDTPLTDTSAAPREQLARVQASLQPKVNREQGLVELHRLFASGSAPDPQPAGFKLGELITMSVSRPSDAAVRFISSLYMPWLGKSFDPERQTGVNVLKPNARAPMNLLWRSYSPELERADRIEAFPFRTRVGPGEIDPDVQVLKIDYDFEPNPDFLIRKILDELVQIDDGLYLGKILFRTKRAWHPIGYFSLHD